MLLWLLIRKHFIFILEYCLFGLFNFMFFSLSRLKICSIIWVSVKMLWKMPQRSMEKLLKLLVVMLYTIQGLHFLWRRYYMFIFCLITYKKNVATTRTQTYIRYNYFPKHASFNYSSWLCINFLFHSFVEMYFHVYVFSVQRILLNAKLHKNSSQINQNNFNKLINLWNFS